MSWDWDGIKRVVSKTAPILGNALGPAGGVAGSLIAAALDVEPEPNAIAQALERDPTAAIKLQQLQNDHRERLEAMTLEAETVRLQEINATMRAEAAADDPYVRRWRPTWGYATCLSWVITFLAIAAAIVGAAFVYPEHADKILGGIATLVGSMLTLWGIALGVLGINIRARSRDKRARAGQDGTGALERLADALARPARD